jgi:hypothetical protein
METSVKHLLLLLVMLGLYGCYTPKPTYTQYKEKLSQPIYDFIPLYVETTAEIYELDEATYDEAVKGRFNNMKNKRFRDFIQNKFTKEYIATLIHDYTIFFEDHHPYSFEAFKEQLLENQINYILLITKTVERPMVGEVYLGENMAFPVNQIGKMYQIYLFDVKNERPLWISHGFPTVTGGLTGPRNVARHLARGTAKALENEGIIYARRSGKPYYTSK